MIKIILKNQGNQTKMEKLIGGQHHNNFVELAFLNKWLENYNSSKITVISRLEMLHSVNSWHIVYSILLCYKRRRRRIIRVALTV